MLIFVAVLHRIILFTGYEVGWFDRGDHVDVVTSFLVFGTEPSFVHCVIFYILYMSHYLG